MFTAPSCFIRSLPQVSSSGNFHRRGPKAGATASRVKAINVSFWTVRHVSNQGTLAVAKDAVCATDFYVVRHYLHTLYVMALNYRRTTHKTAYEQLCCHTHRIL
jgi:hypothetical protein